jgi:hypothetical protein
MQWWKLRLVFSVVPLCNSVGVCQCCNEACWKHLHSISAPCLFYDGGSMFLQHCVRDNFFKFLLPAETFCKEEKLGVRNQETLWHTRKHRWNQIYFSSSYQNVEQYYNGINNTLNCLKICNNNKICCYLYNLKSGFALSCCYLLDCFSAGF